MQGQKSFPAQHDTHGVGLQALLCLDQHGALSSSITAASPLTEGGVLPVFLSSPLLIILLSLLHRLMTFLKSHTKSVPHF